MGVDDAERLVLVLQIFDQPGQHDVLDHIGEISGMIGVAVVHATPVSAGSAPLPQRGGGGCEFGFCGGRVPPRRNDSTSPMKPTAISENPTGWARGSIAPAPATQDRASTDLMSMPSASPGPTVNGMVAVFDLGDRAGIVAIDALGQLRAGFARLRLRKSQRLGKHGAPGRSRRQRQDRASAARTPAASTP